MLARARTAATSRPARLPALLVGLVAALGLAAPARAALTEVTPPFVGAVNAAAILVAPQWVAIDPAADGSATRVYVSDGSRKLVLRYTPDGQTLAGQYPTTTSTSGPLEQPRGVAVDPATHAVYVADSSGQRVLRMTPAGVPDAQAPGALAPTGCPSTCPGPSAQPGRFATPIGLAFDGTLLTVADNVNNRLQRFDAGLAFLAPPWPLSAAPIGVATVPGTGELLVTRADGTLQLRSPDGTLERDYGAGVLSAPRGVALDAATRVVFVTDAATKVVQTFDFDTGAALQSITPGFSATSGPSGVALDPVTHIAYVADPSGPSVRRFRYSSPPDCRPADVQSAPTASVPVSCTDADAAPVTYELVEPPTHGTAAIAPQAGTATYTPQAGYGGPDAFTYRARSINGTSPVAAVRVLPAPAVAPPTTPPTCAPQGATAPRVTGTTITLRCPGANAFRIRGAPRGGTLTGPDASGRLRYVPERQFVGSDSFTYEASGTGGTSAPQAVTLTVPRALPPPASHRSANIQRSSGRVLIRVPGAKAYVPLRADAQVPLHTIVDARRGRVTVRVASDGAGHVQEGDFYAGRFEILQTSGPLPVAVMRLVGGTFKGKAPRDDTPRPAGARGVRGSAARARRKPKSVRHLWGDAHGRFRTTGRGASASVRGTKWLTTDYPTWTSVRVDRGVVAVRDFRRHRTVLVRAGRRYTTPH